MLAPSKKLKEANMTKTQLQRLKEQREKLNARIQAAEAREKSSERKRDARRKILVGAYYLEQAEKNNTMDDIKKLMDGFLKRDSDRYLFDLPNFKKN